MIPGLRDPEVGVVEVAGVQPVYRYRSAPSGLATRRQLRAEGLRPGAPAVAVIRWRRGLRWAGLYALAEAVPVGVPTLQQAAALDAAMLVRRTCSACGVVAEYCLPTRWSAAGRRECLDCLERRGAWEVAA